jgi:hypothetical protein
MSEYQYYEFRRIDGRLSEKEQRELRSFSSRGRITPTSFINEYDFGNFKGDPNAWMEKYFDGHLYFANWGTRELHLAIPAALLPLKTARQYCCSQVAATREKSGKLIVTFSSNDESGDNCTEDEFQLSAMLPIRDELARGDVRSLYIGWLSGVQSGEVEEEEKEPPVPPNLEALSGPQETLAEFLRIDPRLLAVAAKSSPRAKTDVADRQKLSRWVASLRAAEKDEILIRLMIGEEAKLRLELQSRFNQQQSPGDSGTTTKPRTAAQILAAAEAHGQDR